MIHVLGNDPKKVDLKDLGDCVYFKQQKVFSEDQYRRSQDLQKALKKGSLTILKRISEKDGDFDIPDICLHDPVKKEINSSAAFSPNKDFDELNYRINKIEEVVSKSTHHQENSQLQELIDKVNSLEESIIGDKSNDSISVTLLNVIKNLEQKIEQNEKSSEIVDKLYKLLSRNPTAVVNGGYVDKNDTVTLHEEVYIPNVTVEDANTHIKLDVRKIEKGNKVQDALQKLKELKSKST